MAAHDTPNDLLCVQVTVPREQAAELAHALVDDALAACVQQLAVDSTYRWEQTIESAAEALLLIKTTQARYAALAARVRARHPYDVPEILALPVTYADPEYAAWVRASVEPRP